MSVFLRRAYSLPEPVDPQAFPWTLPVFAAGVDYLMAYQDADIFSFDGGALHKVAYEDTDHYRITRDFLNAPERFLRHLMPKPPTHG